MDLQRIQKGVLLILQGIGLDPSDPNYRDTPKRVARMYKEILSPREARWSIFPAATSDLVMLRGHEVIGLCPHHLLPVEFTCHVGYIPQDKTVGISKLARIIETQLEVPLLQEDLAHHVALQLEHTLRPKGVGVVIAGVHGCMRHRGVKSRGDIVVSSMRGVLLLNPMARAEFLQLVGTP